MFDFVDSADMKELGRAIDARCLELNIRPESIDTVLTSPSMICELDKAVAFYGVI